MYDARKGLGPVLRREVRPALAGVIAAGVSFGVTEIFAGLISGGPSLIIAVGSGVIDLSPKFAKDYTSANEGGRRGRTSPSRSLASTTSSCSSFPSW